MDSLTHLAAGALTPLAFRNAPKTRMMILFGIIAGEFPDIDVLAGKSPEAILAFHRGPTHSLVAQPLFAFVLALAFHRLIKKGDDSGAWTFAKTWTVALTALLIHLFLDAMTTFGTQIFLPFSDMRVAFPAIYIIDLALTVPLLAILSYILWRWRRSPESTATGKDARVSLARKALVWMFTYPILALLLNYGMAPALTKEYARDDTRGMTAVELSPEPFTPLNWKAVGIGPEAYFMGRYSPLFPGREIQFTEYRRPEPALWQALQDAVPLFRLYAKFTTFPFVTVAEEDGAVIHTFADVRYEPTLPGLLKVLGRDDGIFLMQARFENGEFTAYRFLYRGRNAPATPWETAPGGLRHDG